MGNGERANELRRNAEKWKDLAREAAKEGGSLDMNLKAFIDDVAAQDVWETGVRVTANEEGIVERGEINRCLDLVMGNGERANELRRNAEKWKDLAREAAKEGGSLDMNLKAFIDDVAAQGCK
ncbi:hypothetical protein QQP08_014731 [Theobroma cacao]|nr:hypothetical protein QQP08_014731 [Theobroma cacao]